MRKAYDPKVKKAHGRIYQRQGAALPMVLYLLVVFGFLMAGLLLVSVQSYDAMAARGAYEQTLYAAEAGVNIMLGQLAEYLDGNISTMPTHISGNLGEGLGSYDVVITSTSLGSSSSGCHHGHHGGGGGGGGGSTPPPTPTTEGAWFWIKATGRIGSHTRVIHVKLQDTPWINPWSHIYYTSRDWCEANGLMNSSGLPGRPNYRPPYAIVHGRAQLKPESPADPHGPACGDELPVPDWDAMREEAVREQSTDTNGNGVIDEEEMDYEVPGCHSVNAQHDVHYYWSDNGSSFPLIAHFLDTDFFVYFGSLGWQPEVFDGVYYVHGTAIIGPHAKINGMIVATDDVLGAGNAHRIIDTAMHYQDIDPTETNPYTRTPAIVAQRNIKFCSNDMTVLGAMFAGNKVTIHASSVHGCIVAPQLELTGLGDFCHWCTNDPYDIQYGFAEPIGYYCEWTGMFPIYPPYVDPDGNYDESIWYFPGRYKMPYFTDPNSDGKGLHYEVGTYWED